MNTTVNPWDIEIVRDAMLRHGMSSAEADEVVQTCISECAAGDTGLLDLLREKALH